MNGIVFDIQRMSLNDGPGIRTSIFLKGCPLNCLWCHNPESKNTSPELYYKQEKCVSCGRCAAICPCHALLDGKHQLNRKSCLKCFRCVNACLSDALEICGREMSVDQVIETALKDMLFYHYSGGGITFTGGEPLLQFDFLMALAVKAKQHGLHICLETCGFTSFERLKLLIPYVDLFLYDIKETDPDRHKLYTCVDNSLILENLSLLDNEGATIILRCPVIPDLNDRDEHFSHIAAIANQMKHIQSIDIEPYHPLGQTKCDWLGTEYPVDETIFPAKDLVESWIQKIKRQTSVLVRMA